MVRDRLVLVDPGVAGAMRLSRCSIDVVLALRLSRSSDGVTGGEDEMLFFFRELVGIVVVGDENREEAGVVASVSLSVSTTLSRGCPSE